MEILFKSSLRGLALGLEDGLHDPVQVLNRSSGDHGEISLAGPCTKILQMPCLTGAFMKAQDLVREALGRFLSQDLVSSAPAAAGPFMTIL